MAKKVAAKFQVVGRALDGNSVVGYRIQKEDGSCLLCKKDLMYFLVGRGLVGNCRGQLYEDGVALQGTGGTVLKELPSVKVTSKNRDDTEQTKEVKEKVVIDKSKLGIGKKKEEQEQEKEIKTSKEASNTAKSDRATKQAKPAKSLEDIISTISEDELVSAILGMRHLSNSKLLDYIQNVTGKTIEEFEAMNESQVVKMLSNIKDRKDLVKVLAISLKRF